MEDPPFSFFSKPRDLLDLMTNQLPAGESLSPAAAGPQYSEAIMKVRPLLPPFQF